MHLLTTVFLSLAATLVPPAAPSRLTLTADAVGTVAVGGPAARMRAEVSARFGRPTRVRGLTPCELAGPTDVKERAFTWKNLTVTVASKAGAPETVAAWSVTPGRLSPRLDMPYGVGTTTTVPKALSLIPAATGKYDEVFGFYAIRTPSAPDLLWTSDNRDGSGPVTRIAAHPTFCE
ncbi:hypothetical protein [Actinoplanes couchii]|uniref:Secreted protein n=1 Tax=Actinoplanes couchii TaxID=403638 RepID=A0ABQ3XK42_9ACTN|nr:hypothetical protein [Actinoplanes couchii]MDR6320468.1 hypothetical protein [Actinoplanes couchii]GID58871.1 hypothetical protein Aco03nite_072750 [Actinoplanes couchii]